MDVKTFDLNEDTNLKEKALIILCNDGFITKTFDDDDEKKLDVHMNMCDYEVRKSDDSMFEIMMKQL